MPKIKDGISKTTFVNWLRRQGYEFRRQAKRSDIWRKADRPLVLVQRRSVLSVAVVAQHMRQIGLGQEEIKRTIAEMRG